MRVRLWQRGVMVLAATLAMGAAPRRRAPPPPPLPQYGPPRPPTPYDLCDEATTVARTPVVPPTLLPAIARVESGRLDPLTGQVRPWPWTINVDGVGTFFETKEAAVAAVSALQAKGVKSIDVGCMQVNLMYHATAFATLDDAFDPPTNAAYAVKFLTALHGQFKDWNLATAAYHSQEQDRGEDYQRRVFGRVMTPMGPPKLQATPGFPAGVIFGALPPPSSMFGAIPPPTMMFGAFAPAGSFSPPPGARRRGGSP